MSVPIPERYCSTIQLQLIVEGQVHRLSKAAYDFVYLREPVLLPPGDAEVIMYVDGEPRSWPVKLPYGAVPFDDEVAISIK